MAKAERTAVFTKDIFALQEAVEKGKEEFRKEFLENSLRLHNCSCGDSFLQGALLKICYTAIEKYILI